MGLSDRRRSRVDHPDGWIFGPTRSLHREVIEKRPPVLRIALIAGFAVVASAVSALALAGTGGSGGTDVAGAGVPEGTRLTRTGNVRATEVGQVVDALDVRGYIYVLADDVTIRRTSVRSGGPHAIRVGRGVTGVRVEDSTLTCTTDRGRAGVAHGNYAATRVEVSAGCRRGFLYDEATTTITDSFWDGEPFPDVLGGSEPSPSTTGPPTTAPSTTAPPTAPPTTSPGPDEPSPGPAPTGDFPTAATTGVPAGTQLRPSSGITVGEPGGVVDGLDVRGTIVVAAPGVTIRNTRITTGGDQGVRIMPGASLTIEDSEIVGTGDRCNEAISFSNYTAVRIDVSGCQDGLKANGNTTVRDSYIHGLRQTEGSHNDGIQVMLGRNITIEGNTICGQYKDTVSAIKMTPEMGAIDGVTIRENMLYGGGYTVYMDSKPNTFGQVTNAVVEDNVMDVGSARWGAWAVDSHPTQRIADNVVGDITDVMAPNPCAA